MNEAALEAGARASALLIDDADRVGEAEAELFHLVNAALHKDAWLLLTARAAPDAWGLKTADLLSRLRLAPVVRLAAPDLELTEAVLYKLFSDRQLQVEPNVASYIALRIERSLGAARQLVALLDREALARGRRVTRAMASEFMRAPRWRIVIASHKFVVNVWLTHFAAARREGSRAAGGLGVQKIHPRTRRRRCGSPSF